MAQKSALLTFILSFVVAGLGHLYLGLNRRGLQFMVGFFACIVLIPSVPMVFPFALAIVWFYSLFDALQRATAINHYVSVGKQSITGELDGAAAQSLSQLDLGLVSTEALQGNKSFSPVWIGAVSILMGVIVLIHVIWPSLWALLLRVHIGDILLAAALIGFGIWVIRTQREGK